MADGRTPTTKELWQLIQVQREEIERQRVELAQLQSRMTTDPESKPREPGVPDKMEPDGRSLSRKGLLKAAAAGVAGIAGAEALGSLGTPAALAATDTHYLATGGTGTAFSTDTHGYLVGVAVVGNDYGVTGYAADSSGAVNGGTGVLGKTGSAIGVWGQTVGTAAGSPPGNGVVGQAGNSRFTISSAPNTGVRGVSVTGGIGVLGETRDDRGNLANGIGVKGQSQSNVGVLGSSITGFGVEGNSDTGWGVTGQSVTSYGGQFSTIQGTGVVAAQEGFLTANNGAPCLQAVRAGGNSSGNSYNYSGPLIHGVDSPASGAPGSGTPLSTGPLLLLQKGGSTKCKVDGNGTLTLAGDMILTGPSTAGTASAGSKAVPATAAGYLVVTIGASKFKIPYYNL